MRHSGTLAGSEEVSAAQLEYEDDRRSDSDSRRAKRPEETAAEPKSNPAGDPALAGHARTARTAMEKAGCPMTEAQSLRFTAGLLANLKKKAGEVSPKEFAETLGELCASVDEGSGADSPTIPLCPAGSRRTATPIHAVRFG